MSTQKSTELRKKAMLECLRLHLGVVTPAAKEAGVSREAHYDWMNNDPEYRRAVQDMEDIPLDFAESHLFKQIKSGIPSSTIFYLKTKGKKRGYVEASEQVIYTPDKGPTWLDGSSID